MTEDIWSWIKTFLLAIIISMVLLNNPVFAMYKVDGNSMLPTLKNGQVLVINKDLNIQRGEIIVFEEPDPTYRGQSKLVKRVIALPGDWVNIQHGQVYVNGISLTEEYVDLAISGSWSPRFIEAGWLFVLGDNRSPGGSRDSRSFGLVEIETVVGKASLVVFPWPGKLE